jgi:hypothetical protein
MAIQTSSNLSNAVTTRYTTRYQRAAELMRLYDQLATPVGAPQFELETRRGLGSTYTFNFVSDMTPGLPPFRKLLTSLRRFCVTLPAPSPPLPALKL